MPFLVLVAILSFMRVAALAIPPLPIMSTKLSAAAIDTEGGIRVQGPGVAPQLGFACCNQDIQQAQLLFDTPGLLVSLRNLHAILAMPILDFSPQRVALVQRLNQAGIPLVAGIVLPDGGDFYLNADDAPKATARVAAFEQWTSDNHLQWSAVGLDIEPNFTELASLKTHRWRLLTTLVRRSFDFPRIERARQAYSALIAQTQAHGFPVQTYQLPFLPAERWAHSTLIDRLLGTVDVRGNEEYLMIYTVYARPAGAGIIWLLGPNTQSIAIGSTAGDGTPGTPTGPLDWNEFSRDLLVASHFRNHIGIYNLEGCIRQGFLPRLETFNWSQSVFIPAASIHRAERLGTVVPAILFALSHFVYLLVAMLLLIPLLVVRRRRKRTLRLPPAP
jgi:hypothetical protein